MNFQYSLSGFDSLDKELSKLSSRTESRIGKKALRAGAKPIVSDAKKNVTVETGDLKKSIGTQMMNPKRGKLEIRIGPRVGKSAAHSGHYGHIVEYGYGRQAPQPFLRPAFDTNNKKSIQIIGAVLWREIVKENAK